jgi:ornithine carbamoyltransferase
MDRKVLAGRDYIETIDWTIEELDEVIAVSRELKEQRRRGEPHHLLPDKTVYLLFLDKSTRTRNAFETGIAQLGGHGIFLDADKTQIAHGESPKDMGIILSRYGEGLAIRHDLVPYEGNAWMREVARWADIPVINLQCDIDHPTQTIADLMTLREHRGEDLRGLRVAVTWAFAPSYARPLSVPQGLVTLLPRFGIDVTLAHPPGWDLMPESMEKAQRACEEGGGSLSLTDSMEDAFRDADVVYPKSWGRLGAFSDQEAAKATEYVGWIADAEKMELTKRDSLYMHCLPADRGKEVTDEVIDGPHSVVYDEAENRMHTGKALMALTMGGYAE